MRDLQFCLANFYHRTLFSLTLPHIEQTISLLCFATVGMRFNNSRGSHVTWAIILFQMFCRLYKKIPFPFFSPSSRPLLRANIYVQLFLGTLSRYSKSQCTHRSDVLITDRPHQTQVTNAVVVPSWKKELAEKRKQRSPVTRPPAKRMNRVRFRNYRYGKGKSPREESAENFCQVKSSLRKQTTLQKDLNGNGDWKTHDETNRSWPQKDHRKIRQTRSRFLWRSLKSISVK